MSDKPSPGDIKRLKEGLISSWMPRAEFDALLEESGLPDKIADVYLRRWQEGWKHMPGTDEDRARLKERVERNIRPVADKLREYLPQTLYYAAGLLAYQLTVSKSKPQTKAFTRFLVDLFFFQDDRIPLVDGRGRKSKIKSGDVYDAVVKRGKDASRKGVAYDLGVSEKALNDWRKANEYPTWKAAVEYMITVRKKITG